MIISDVDKLEVDTKENVQKDLNDTDVFTNSTNYALKRIETRQKKAN